MVWKSIVVCYCSRLFEPRDQRVCKTKFKQTNKVQTINNVQTNQTNKVHRFFQSFKQDMPGRNCAFPTCTVSYTNKHSFMSSFRIPTRKCDSDWKNDIVKVLNKYRKVDKSLQERIDAGRVYICERHFKPEDFELTSKFMYIHIYIHICVCMYTIYIYLFIY